MADAIPPPPDGARHRFWKAIEFNHLGDHGWFEGRRAVLIDGVILEWGQMPPSHATACELAANELRTVFGTGWRVRQLMPLHLTEWTDPVPDLAVIRGEIRDYADRHPTTAVLAVEVSDKSLDFDCTVKAEKYAAAGIPDYWVIDVISKRLLVFRDPRPAVGHGYRTRQTLGPTDVIAPLAAPHATIRVADLLP